MNCFKELRIHALNPFLDLHLKHHTDPFKYALLCKLAYSQKTTREYSRWLVKKFFADGEWEAEVCLKLHSICGKDQEIKMFFVSYFQEGTDVHKVLEWSSRVLQRLVEEGAGWLAVFCPAGKGAKKLLYSSSRAGLMAAL